MRFIILILLTLTSLFSSEWIIEKTHYTIATETIQARDIDPNLHIDFSLGEFGNRKRMRIAKNKLKRLADTYGLTLQCDLPYITLERAMEYDQGPLYDYIHNAYLEVYPELMIHQLDLTPSNHFVQGDATLQSLHLPHNALKRASGTLRAIYHTPDGMQKRLFFRYTLNAELEVLKTTQRLERHASLQGATQSSTMSFTTLTRTPLSPSYLKNQKGEWRAKRRLKAGSVILKDDIEPMPLIHRNDPVDVTLQEGAIMITFRAKALNEGALYDAVRIQMSSGEIRTATVIGPRRVSLP